MIVSIRFWEFRIVIGVLRPVPLLSGADHALRSWRVTSELYTKKFSFTEGQSMLQNVPEVDHNRDWQYDFSFKINAKLVRVEIILKLQRSNFSRVTNRRSQ